MIKYLTIFFISLPALCFSADKADPYCFISAGVKYNISPTLLWAISKVESGHNITAVNRNKNKSIDKGHMQINSFWKNRFPEQWKNIFDPCVCSHVGAWILSDCVRRYGYTWEAVACYHTGSGFKEVTPKKANRAIKYVNLVKKALN